MAVASSSILLLSLALADEWLVSVNISLWFNFLTLLIFQG